MMVRSSVPVVGTPYERLIAQLANHCAALFRAAQSDVSFPYGPLDVACAGGTARAGFLAAALQTRELLQSSPEGRKALSHLGFEPLLEQVEGE